MSRNLRETNIGLGLIAFGLFQAFGQIRESQLTFEVASIKPSGPQSIRGSDGGPGSSDPGRYSFGSASLLDLMAVAYNVPYFRISSSIPLDKELFDIAVKVPTGATKQQFRLMMQNLLAERFHLKLHTQSKEFPAYELVVAKTGPKLRESTSDGSPQQPSMALNHSAAGGFELMRLKAQQQPMSAVVMMLRSPGNLPIVDRSGLTGKYDFTLEYTLEPPGAPTPDAPPIAPSLFTALQEQLGLQLVSKKLPFDVLVIDQVDRVPTEN